MAVNMLMMGKSLEEYYRTNCAEYGVMLLANQLANGMTHSDTEEDVKQEQEPEKKYARLSDFLAAKRAARDGVAS